MLRSTLARLSPPSTPVRCARLSSGSALALQSRSAYPHAERRQTRWNDMDAFGHVNNAVYYQYFDDAVNCHLLARGVGLKHPRFVASSSCQYFRPFSYPSDVEVGLRLARLGSSSATYDIGVFPLSPEDGAPGPAAAVGTWVHVYVDSDGRPTPIPDVVRSVLNQLAVPS